MREIKFRGKSIMPIEELDQLEIKHENGWVTGNLIVDGKRFYIVGDVADCEDEYINFDFWVRIIQGTAVQYTGLKDKNGREIYEGDLLYHPLQGVRKVFYPFNENVASFGLVNKAGWTNTLQDATALYKVIGNIHENPELLEVKS